MSLEDKVLMIADLRRKLYIKHDDLIKELVDNGTCHHSITENYVWEFDNGYGKQTNKIGVRCLACGFKDPYNDGRFRGPY